GQTSTSWRFFLQRNRWVGTSLHGEITPLAFSPRRDPSLCVSLHRENSALAFLSAERSQPWHFSLQRDLRHGASLRGEITPWHFSPRRDHTFGFLSAERS